MLETIALIGAAVAGYYYWQSKGSPNPFASAPAKAAAAANPAPTAAQVNNSASIVAQEQKNFQALESTISGQSVSGVSTTGVASAAAGGATTGFGLAASIGPVGAAVAGAAIAGTAIFGLITAHHKQAVAHEASLLNNATPRSLQLFMGIMQAVVAKQITVSQARTLLQNVTNDYYTLVTGGGSGQIEGRWPWNAADGMSSTGANSWGRKPSPCNGPCVVGHYWIEGNQWRCNLALDAISKGQHGTLSFDAIPSHAGFTGAPAMSMAY